SLRNVRKAAMKMKAGGVGYYPKSNFVHVDTGPVRAW
ncbi:MAG: YcbK family protein, partial [Plesiomonas shigelloides]